VRLFLSILAGETADAAEPVFASDDEQVIRSAVRALLERLGPAADPALLALAPSRRGALEVVRDEVEP
jgi:hypothetical protein